MSCNAPAGTENSNTHQTAAGREPVLEYGRMGVRANVTLEGVACAAPDSAVINYARNGHRRDAGRGRWQLQPRVRQRGPKLGLPWEAQSAA